MQLNIRIFNLLGLVFCLAMLGSSFYLQYGMALEPCPLCMLARITVIILTILFLVGIILPLKKIGQKIFAGLTSLAALFGLSVSARHVYLQHLPADQVPDCGPGFDYIIQSFPFSEALAIILKGSGQCSEISLRFLGLSLAEWTGIAFLALVLFTLTPIFKNFSRSP